MVFTRCKIDVTQLITRLIGAELDPLGFRPAQQVLRDGFRVVGQNALAHQVAQQLVARFRPDVQHLLAPRGEGFLATQSLPHLAGIAV